MQIKAVASPTESERLAKGGSAFVPFSQLPIELPQENLAFDIKRFQERGNQSFKVVSFYTENNEYLEHAKRLRASLNKYQIDHDLCAIRDDGVWESVCARKAKFVQECWRSSELPIVWIDADATVESFPELFRDLDADFAIHKWNGWQFASGTIYFGKTAVAEELIECWVRRCEADPITWDQTHLQSAWCDVAARQVIRSFWLPRSYSQIFDATEEGTPVVKHWQASRRPKREGRSSIHRQLEVTAKGVHQRRGERPWRGVEKGPWRKNEKALQQWRGGENSAQIGPALRNAIGDQYPLLEIGCGTGLHATFFEPEKYIGIDRNPFSLVQARKSFPQHVFRIFDDGYELPPAPSVMFVDIFHFISDDQLSEVLEPIVNGRSRVVIAETMADNSGSRARAPFQIRRSDFYASVMKRLRFAVSKFEQIDGTSNGSQNASFGILSFVKAPSDVVVKQDADVNQAGILTEIIGHLSRFRTSLRS